MDEVNHDRIQAASLFFNSLLDVAMRNASMEMLGLLTEHKGLAREDAYSLVSIAADFSVTQVVDGRQGVHARIPRHIFPPGSDETT